MPDTVSIVIPTYNRADVIGKAVESVLHQTYQNWELFIVDDGSTDHTKKLIESQYSGDPRITYLQRPETRPKGANACRNIGIEKATGEYIALLDSDDEWYPQKLEEQVSFLTAKEYESRKVLCYSQADIVRKQAREIKPKQGINKGERVSDYLILNDGLIQTSSILLNSALSNEVRFDESLPRHQDIDFVLNAERCDAVFVFIEKALVKLNWDSSKNLYDTGWTPEYSEDFAKKRRELFSEKSYQNFLFTKIVVNCAKYKSKSEALKKIGKVKFRHIRLRYLAGFLKVLLKGGE